MNTDDNIRQIKEAERAEEEARVADDWKKEVRKVLEERDIRLIKNCINYANHDPAGLPGHQLMLVVAKLCELFGFDPEVA